MSRVLQFGLFGSLFWLTACSVTPTEHPTSTAADGWDFAMTAPEVTSLCETAVQDAQKALTKLENDTAPATLTRVFAAYDAINFELQRIQHVWYLTAVHPDTDVQAAAEQCISLYTDFFSSVEQSQKFYRRVAAIDLQAVTPTEKLMVERKLRDFRKAGVHLDEATRAQARTLINRIAELGNQFDRNIREDTRYVDTTAAQLQGLPQDYLDAHPADAQGIVRISTDYPDLLPVLSYATDDDLRRRLFIAQKTIATPANATVLQELIASRHELATLLGYASWAALAVDGLMVESPQAVQHFLAEVGSAARAPAGRELAQLLARLQQIDPLATRVQEWQVGYLSQLIQRENYALDAQQIRQYLSFERVQAGIFELTEDLFGVEIVPWQTQTWHEDVTAWEVREQGKPIGRFYLDLHPRPNKYNHAAHWTLRMGLKDRQLPLSGLATNFPRDFMEHDNVTTFLHEFGHLLHNMFSGTQDWLDIAGMSMERDFVEAPSQMLEEWAWDYDTLRTFARNEKGEEIPEELVTKMNRARNFGVAVATAKQIFYANLSLSYYQLEPDSFALQPLLESMQNELSPFPYVPGTHFYNNFGHLNGYSSTYYTYQWSEAISTDLLSRFRQDGLHNQATAGAYRNSILAPAGSRPAITLIEDFLGRPFSIEPYTRYLNGLN